MLATKKNALFMSTYLLSVDSRLKTAGMTVYFFCVVHSCMCGFLDLTQTKLAVIPAQAGIHLINESG